MKILKKFNRGAILSFFILLAVIAYLVVTAISQNAEKPKIQAACEKYIQIEIKYKMLPEKFRIAKPIITKAELDSYVADMESEIKAFYPNDTQSSKFIIDTLKASLTDQANGSGVVYDFKKEIKKYDSFVFDKDSVTVNFTASTVYQGPDSNGPSPLVKPEVILAPSSALISAPISAPISADTADVLILQKIDGEWKIVYSNLNIPYNTLNPGLKY